MTPSDKTVFENQELTFHCIAIGNPTPKITWSKDGEVIGQSDVLSLNAKRNNSGKYWCFAENEVGLTANSSAYLNVQCKYLCSCVLLIACSNPWPKRWAIHLVLSALID